jgi:hypothetical protein
MKNQILSVLTAALVSVFAGCAMESDGPTEGITSSNVTVGTTNYVVCTNKLARRTCDNPGACDTGDRMVAGTTMVVDAVDSARKMAHFTNSAYGSGWALAENNGEPYISANPNAQCDD